MKRRIFICLIISQFFLFLFNFANADGSYNFNITNVGLGKCAGSVSETCPFNKTFGVFNLEPNGSTSIPVSESWECSSVEAGYQFNINLIVPSNISGTFDTKGMSNGETCNINVNCSSSNNGPSILVASGQTCTPY